MKYILRLIGRVSRKWVLLDSFQWKIPNFVNDPYLYSWRNKERRIIFGQLMHNSTGKIKVNQKEV